MPRTFLVKPLPLDSVPVTSESSVTVSVDALPWLQVDRDFNNNVDRPSSTTLRPPGPTDELARWPYDVAGGLRWWSMSAGVIGQRCDVTSSARCPPSPPTSTAAEATKSGTTTNEDAQHLWWSASPHSDVSASGITSLVTFIIVRNET